MEKNRLSPEEELEQLKARNAELEAQNAALSTAVETGVKPIVGKFKATVKVKGESKVFTYELGKKHPRLVCCNDGKNRDAESLIAVANGKKVEGFDLDKEAAQAQLQHLVDIEYGYLVVVSDK